MLSSSHDPASEKELVANKALIEKFYQAFSQRDHQTMNECYHPDVYFKDAAFELCGKRVNAMWHMLCERGKDLQIEYSVQIKNDKICAHWEPKYTFSQTGRHVHNIVDAEFEFKEGKIIRHIDSFDFWRWSQQALGFVGLILGWTSLLQKRVNSMAERSLIAFIDKNPEYQ